MPVQRLAQINYAIRTAAFAWCFLVAGLVLWERQAGAGAWIAAGLLFLVYPHLAYLHAMRARDSRRAEFLNLYADSVLLGALLASLGFPSWVLYAALFATTLNNMVMRGPAGAAVSVVLFAAGALAWVLPMGLMYYPHTSGIVTLLCFIGSLAYTCGVGSVVHRQNLRLQAARERMREGERRYRLITEHAGDLVAMVDRDARWLYASPSYAKILDPQNLAAGRDAFSSLHEEDQFRVRGALQVVMRSGETCRLRLRLRTRDGDVRRFEALVHAVRDEAGAVTGAVLASRDVTELRDREEQLEVAAHAFERMAEAMVITNAAGRILTINQSFTRITGYAAEEVIGRPEADFRSAMQPQMFYDDLYAEVLRSGYWQGTTWCRRRDGTVYREWRSVSAVRDAEEHITHYVSLFRELNGHAADARPAMSA
jgi:PAS domain S-box-containing protein